MKLIIATLILFSCTVLASEKESPVNSQEKDEVTAQQKLKLKDFSVWEDLKESVSYMGKGAYLQFKGTQNQLLWVVSALTVAYYLHNDKRILEKVKDEKKAPGFVRWISDGSIVANTPFIPALTYSVGTKRNDPKLVSFSKELFATTNLALIETHFLSMIPVHNRPNPHNTTFWEEKFRQESSFPSGHVIGYTALALKTFQYYGFKASILPFALATVTALERVWTEKHYASDVIAAGFLTLLASEGVRMAAQSQWNSPTYKWLFQRDLKIQFLSAKNTYGMRLSFGY